MFFFISGVMVVFFNYSIQRRDFAKGHNDLFEENTARFFQREGLLQDIDNIIDNETLNKNLDIDENYKSFALFEWNKDWEPILVTSPALSVVEFTPTQINKDFYRYYGSLFWKDNIDAILTKTPFLYSAVWKKGRLFLLAVELQHSWLYTHLIFPRHAISLGLLGVIPNSLFFAFLCAFTLNLFGRFYHSKLMETIQGGKYRMPIPVFPGFIKLVEYALSNATEIEQQRREKRVALMEKYNEFEKERGDFALINEVFRVAAFAPDLKSSVNAALQEIIRRLGVRCGFIFTLDATEQPFFIGEYNLPADIAHALLKGESLPTATFSIQEKNNGYAMLPLKALPGIEISPIRSLAEEGLTHAIIIPLYYRDKIWGGMHLYSPGRPRIPDRDKTVLLTISNTLVVILENKRLLGDLDERIKENVHYYELSKMLISTSEFDILLENILWIIHESIDIDHCSIMLADDEGEILSVKAVWGYPNGHKNPRVSFGSGVVGWVAQNGQSALLHDVSLDTRYIENTEDARSELTVPLLADGKVIGVIDCESNIEYTFNEADLRFLTQLSGPVGLAIQRTLVQTALAKQYIIDSISQTYNRNYFDEYISKHGKETLLRHGRVSIAIVGVSNLKEIEKEYGQPASNLIIKQTANMLEELFPEAVIARYTDSEFYILLPGLGEEAMEKLIDSIRKRSLKWSREHADTRPLSFTAGYATATRFDELESLIQRTDKESAWIKDKKHHEN